jgi:hypothetical protein
MYFVRRNSGSWEIRESRSTPRGPRSRTLATFRELTPEVIARVRDRATAPPEPEELRKAALRAGAPIATGPPDRLARELLREVHRGHRPRRELAQLLRDELELDARPVSDAARAAAEWIGASAAERGDTLRDLLSLADALPAKRRGGLRFPPLRSAGA